MKLRSHAGSHMTSGTGGEMRWLDLHSLVDGNVVALNAQLEAEEELARWLELTEAASN